MSATGRDAKAVEIEDEPAPDGEQVSATDDDAEAKYVVVDERLALERLEDAVLPRSLRGLLDMQRGLERMTDPLGASTLGRFTNGIADALGASTLGAFSGGLADSMKANRFAVGIAGAFGTSKLGAFSDGLADSIGASRFADGISGAFDLATRDAYVFDRAALSSSVASAMGALSEHAGLFADHRLADMTAHLNDLLGPTSALSEIASYAKLDRTLGRTLPTSLYEHWQSHLMRSALPSLHVLSMEWDRPTGVLASMEDPHLGASLSWLPPSGKEKTRVAAFVTREEAPSDIAIDVALTCAFCGEPMLVGSHRFRWTGSRKGALDLSVVPICSKCTRRSMEDPDYAARALRRLLAPKLRFVGSRGVTDGVARGKLRLVADSDDE